MSDDEFVDAELDVEGSMVSGLQSGQAIDIVVPEGAKGGDEFTIPVGEVQIFRGYCTY